MRRRAVLVAGAMLAVLALALGVMPDRQAQAAASKTTVEVTYYYLPG
jgi:ABC-type glycerol-3-phosphate transport system substrate-binding protein